MPTGQSGRKNTDVGAVSAYLSLEFLNRPHFDILVPRILQCGSDLCTLSTVRSDDPDVLPLYNSTY